MASFTQGTKMQTMDSDGANSRTSGAMIYNRSLNMFTSKQPGTSNMAPPLRLPTEHVSAQGTTPSKQSKQYYVNLINRYGVNENDTRGNTGQVLSPQDN